MLSQKKDSKELPDSTPGTGMPNMRREAKPHRSPGTGGGMRLRAKGGKKGREARPGKEDFPVMRQGARRGPAYSVCRRMPSLRIFS